MNKWTRLPKWVWAIVALGFSCPGAGAATVTATFSGVNPGHSFTYSLNGTSHGTSAGVYFFTNASGFLSGNLRTFCIDISQSIAVGNVVPFNVDQLQNAPKPGGGMGQARADLIAELYGRHYADTGTADGAAAFQVAVWEITSETQTDPNTGKVVLNLSGGIFRAVTSAAWVTNAQTWLNQLDGTGPKASNLIALTSDTKQDYVTLTPEPSSLVLCTCGVAGLLVTRFRRRSQLF